MYTLKGALSFVCSRILVQIKYKKKSNMYFHSSFKFAKIKTCPSGKSRIFFWGGGMQVEETRDIIRIFRSREFLKYKFSVFPLRLLSSYSQKLFLDKLGLPGNK